MLLVLLLGANVICMACILIIDLQAELFFFLF